jgi:G3E family GTPase
MPEHATAEEYARARDTLDFLVGMVEAEAFTRRLQRTQDRGVPTAVIAGFLGAGKTTLMRHLLTASHGLRIAALVNDFAALNVDAALIADVSGDTVSLANGCICCSQSGGTARALADIVERQEQPHFILIETSGVADPWALAQVTCAVPGISLDCVLTVVDAANCAPDPAVEFLLRRQVSAADIVLLNKTDLASEQETVTAAQWIAGLAPKAQILRTIGCAVPPFLIFDQAAPRTGMDGDGGRTADKDSSFASIVLAAPRSAIEQCLAGLPDGIFRAKGFLRLTDNRGQPELLQAVGRRWSWEIAAESGPECRLVVIGLADVVNGGEIAAQFAPAGLRPA